jgi:transglutaminase-like putative cysteine protease
VSGAGGGLRHTIHLSSLVSIGATLRDPNAATTELFRVQTSDPSYVRMQTLDRFDGSTWSANTGIPVEVQSAGAIQGAPGSWTSSSATITVTSNDLGDDLLVSPADPTVIDIDRPVSWDSASSSLMLNSPPSAGLNYTVTAMRPDLEPEDLEQVPVEDQRDEVIPPAGSVSPAVRATALRWTSEATTPYGKVMAIADHFQRFTYDPSVSFGRSPEAMAAFLDAKRGFCQQFAGVMAAMLRELGIPARVAVGFTSGHPVGIDTYSVRAADMHAWVEVPFAGYGWRTFDPTPGVPTIRPWGTSRSPQPSAGLARGRGAGLRATRRGIP